jgi:hypothetical protein
VTLSSARSVAFIKPSFAKPFPKKGTPGISKFHSASIFVLFSDSGLNVVVLLPIIGPSVIFVTLTVLDVRYDMLSFQFCEQEIWWQHLLFYIKHEYISMSFSKTADIGHISLIPAVVIMKV